MLSKPIDLINTNTQDDKFEFQNNITVEKDEQDKFDIFHLIKPTFYPEEEKGESIIKI
jgi:hypothetical protein